MFYVFFFLFFYVRSAVEKQALDYFVFYYTYTGSIDNQFILRIYMKQGMTSVTDKIYQLLLNSNTVAQIWHDDFLMSSGSTPALAYSFYINTAPNPPYLELKTSVENYTLTSLLDTTNSITYTFGQVTQRAASIDQFTNMYIFGKAGEYARTELTWKDENVFYSIFLMFDYIPSQSVPSSFCEFPNNNPNNTQICAFDMSLLKNPYKFIILFEFDYI